MSDTININNLANGATDATNMAKLSVTSQLKRRPSIHLHDGGQIRELS